MKKQFVYPTSREYGKIDDICTMIVKELEKKHFSIQGVHVDFETYRNEFCEFTSVERISIPELDVILRFGRKQGLFDHDRNDCSSVSELALPKKLLHLYADESGPTYYTYVGKNWEEEKETFFSGFHCNSKLDGSKRTYLKYSGSSTSAGGSSYRASINPYLAHDNDLGREYSPNFNEKKFYRTDDVLDSFATFLEGNVVLFIQTSQEIGIEEKSLSPIGSEWSGAATNENRDIIVQKMTEMLFQGEYEFVSDRGWSSDKRVVSVRGITSGGNKWGGRVSVSDSYGVWGFDTDGKTKIVFSENVMEIFHKSASGNDLHWTITVLDHPKEDEPLLKKRGNAHGKI